MSPSSIIWPLPLPRSSAGQPRKTISPGSSSAIDARAMAAPTPDAAIVLWPQPCPSPGSASYSARIPIRGRSPPRPPRRTARTAVARMPAGWVTSKPWARSDSATHADAWTSSYAGSGFAWIRWDRSRISARAASTAAARRALASACGSAGRTSFRRASIGRSPVVGAAVSSGTDPPGIVVGRVTERSASRRSGPSAFRRERGLGDRGEGEDEEGDRQLEGALEPQHDEHGDDEADPAGPPGGPGPVALVGDPPVPGEDDEPEDRHERQGDGEADQGRPDEPRDRVRDGIPGRHDQPDEHPDDRRGREQAEVDEPVTRFHRRRSLRGAYREVSALPATLDGQMSRKAHQVQAIGSGVAV